jgi:ribulose 1,5-bisphosphate synthetase/thiazole synthase
MEEEEEKEEEEEEGGGGGGGGYSKDIIYMSKSTLVMYEISIPFKKIEAYNMTFLCIF